MHINKKKKKILFRKWHQPESVCGRKSPLVDTPSFWWFYAIWIVSGFSISFVFAFFLWTFWILILFCLVFCFSFLISFFLKFLLFSIVELLSWPFVLFCFFFFLFLLFENENLTPQFCCWLIAKNFPIGKIEVYNKGPMFLEELPSSTVFENKGGNRGKFQSTFSGNQKLPD